MVPRAPSVIAPPPVLRQDWETLAWLASRRSKTLNLDACLVPYFLRRFCGATDKPKSAWFWGPNQETVAAQITKPELTVLRSKPGNPLPLVLRPNQRKSSTLILRLNQEIHAPRLHVHGVDRTQRYSTSRSSGHRVSDLCDHPRSFAPSLLFLSRFSSLHIMPHLPAAHHETNKHDSSNEPKVKGKTTELSQIQIQISPNQWLIIIKSRNWPLGFSQFLSF
jgi:hypothetical protein